MNFETAFKRSLLSPAFIQYGDDAPRPPDEAHVLGRGLENILQGQNQGGRNDDEPKPKKYDRRGCRLLESITPGEVQDAYDIYKGQLISTVSGALITANQFYIFPLPRRQAEIPAAIFGRVKVCLPMDGLARDVRQIELAFPQVRDKPEAVILHPGDLDSRGFIQSFGIRVKIFGSEKDRADFKRHESRFAEAGFAFEYFDHSIETLDSIVPEEDPLPWFHVIGSRWFADIPPSRQDKVRASLWKLCAQETLVINYHPDRTHAKVRTLNEELDYQYRLTDFYLPDPKTPRQILQFIGATFNNIFAEPFNKSTYLSNRQNRITP